MNDQIRALLAQTMNIGQAQIMVYRKVGDTYTVILTNFQKFSGVVLTESEPVVVVTPTKATKRTSSKKSS